MQVITLAQVKALLGLANTTYDAAITASIPYIDSAVKQITRNRFNMQIGLVLENGSTTASLTSIDSYSATGLIDYDFGIEEYLNVGQELEGTGIATGTYIQDIYYNYAATDSINLVTVILSENATADSDGTVVFAGINITYKPIIAKAVWWQTLQTNTKIRNEVWKSRNMGGELIVTKADFDAKIDGSYGVPIWLVKALPRYHGGH